MEQSLSYGIILCAMISVLLGAVFFIVEMNFPRKRGRYWVMVAVRDAEDWIEDYIRDFYRRKDEARAELWLADMGSCDDTIAIAQRLSLRYPGMRIDRSAGFLDADQCDVTIISNSKEKWRIEQDKRGLKVPVTNTSCKTNRTGGQNDR